MSISAEFEAHLRTGLTTLARCWQVKRRDGVTFGFTDHDCDLAFEGQIFGSGSGLTALALEQGTGLNVDNSEALGVLSDVSISEEEISAGRFDHAEVTCWLVNWADVSQRCILFAGHIGEITRSGGAFRAELRGLSEPLNQPMGRVYQKPCSAVLGDKQCGVDIHDPIFSAVFEVVEQHSPEVIEVALNDNFVAGWFQHGVVVDEARGFTGIVKSDEVADGRRELTLWTPLPASLNAGDQIRVVAGCDKRFATCQFKFSNTLNFRGFPDVPGDEWITTLPRQDGANSGRSLR
ncbi:MAG: DUF2163 domain-containing protein [Cognatishimia sp.]|uniref:DUF2163 domain-containing protein n=1 Tax=Cognatishimia sp. TaxID=2211648 RepID=UPI003B8C1F8B